MQKHDTLKLHDLNGKGIYLEGSHAYAPCNNKGIPLNFNPGDTVKVKRVMTTNETLTIGSREYIGRLMVCFRIKSAPRPEVARKVRSFRKHHDNSHKGINSQLRDQLSKFKLPTETMA